MLYIWTEIDCEKHGEGIYRYKEYSFFTHRGNKRNATWLGRNIN